MDCNAFQSINLEEWGQILSAPLKGGRYPISASFELTNRCNLNCLHCYINEPAHEKVVIHREMSTSMIKQIIDQMVAAGVLFLTLTGGEPLLRPDFSEIYTYARQKGMLVILFTNATMLTEAIADLLSDIRPFNVEISIYGATARVYETVTRQPGSFQKCLRGINLILERNLPLTLKTELMTTNFAELPAMKAMADEMNVRFRYDGLLWPRLDGKSQFPVEVQLPLETLVEFDTSDSDRQEAVGKEIERLKELKTRDERVFSCGAGLRNFHLDSQGYMSICTMVREPKFNLNDYSLIEAWQQIGELRNLKRCLPSKCTTCTANALCTHCPGWSQSIYGNFESVVEFVCDHGRLRSESANKHEETIN